jgi:WD40 repeat protein
MSRSADPQEDAAAALFAEWQQLPAEEQDARFDALCVQRPELAEHLHRLRVDATEHARPEGSDVETPGSGTLVLTAEPELRSALETAPELGFARTTTDQGVRYTVLGELGRGGMGVALRVFDTVLRRQLAMKVLVADPTMSDEDRRAIVTRFVDEARVTGCLEHPGIVPVYDLHHEPSGRIFFTMPIIEGADLHDVIRRVHEGDPQWTMPRAVGVILRVCEAVAFAHSRGVLHRDLTPANVRIGKFGEVHVIDWGLAKVLGRVRAAPPQPAAAAAPGTRQRRRWRLGRTPQLTMHGTVLGTPAYMPPEQAEGRIDDLGPRADVYAAGALLYHLLTGVPPYTHPRRELEPERVLRLVRRGRPPPVDRWNRTAPRELVAICEKAMAREPDDRYADMNAMAADLQAYVDGRVVTTFERGRWAAFRKLVQRNRVASLIVAVAIGAIVFNLIEFGISHVRYRRLLDTHDEQLRQARVHAADAVERARRAAYAASVVGASASLAARDVEAAKARLRACDEDLRGWEWAHLQLRTDGALHVGELPVRPVAVATDGERVLVGDESGAVLVLPADARQDTRRIAVGDRPVEELALVGDGSLLVRQRGGGVAAVDGDGRVRWTAADHVIALARASDGVVLGCAADGSVLAWRGGERTPVAGPTATPPRLAAFARGMVATVHGDGEIVVRRTADGQRASAFAANAPVTALAFAGDAGSLALGTATGAIRLYDPLDGALRDVLAGPADGVDRLVFDSTGERLAAASGALVRVWTLQDREAVELRGHDADVVGVHFVAGGEELVTASRDRTVRRWSALGGVATTPYRGFGSPLACGALGPDGRQAWFGTSDGFVIGRDTVGGRTTWLWRLDDGCARLAVAGDGVFVQRMDGRLVRLSAVDLDGAPRPLAGDDVSVVALAGAGGHVVCARADGRVELRRANGDVERAWRAHDVAVAAVAATPELVATAADDRRLRLWRLPGGELAHELHLDRLPRAIALRPDGGAIAFDSGDGTVRVHELATAATRELRHAHGAITALAWCGDAARLATGGDDATIGVWALDSGERLLTLRDHGGPVHTLAFHRDSGRLLTIATDTGAVILESAASAPRDASRREGHRAEQVLERALAPLADPADEAQVRAALQTGEGISAAELRLGVVLARTRALRAARLRDDAWAIVLEPGATASRRQLALAKVRAAAALGRDPRLAIVEGAALVRCGEPELAARLLQRVDGVPPAMAAAGVVFEGLAAVARGDLDTASRCRERALGSVAALDAAAPERHQATALFAELDAALASARAQPRR